MDDDLENRSADLARPPPSNASSPMPSNLNAASPPNPLSRHNSRHTIVSIEDNNIPLTSQAPIASATTSQPVSHSSETSSPAVLSESNQGAEGIRWYFEQSSDSGIIGKIGAISQTPIVVPFNQSWEIGQIKRGWYSIILGVTLNSEFIHDSDMLKIEMKQLNSNRRALYSVNICKSPSLFLLLFCL
ncbi:hypothetical protein BX616_010275 [Lobosporangium transversale]|nr:hypothetical protein BX616_010275 [Lobosporangium transversale]